MTQDREGAAGEDRRSSADPAGGLAIALVADLLFASRIRGAANAVGARALTVRTADELIERSREVAPRLILLDLEARGVNAPALIERLKADPELSSVPVIAFGSHVRGEALLAARRAGADRVLARSAFVRDLPSLLRGMDAVDKDP